MNATHQRPVGRSIGAIVFNLIVIGFVGLLVTNALGLRPGAALVPLLIGVPTLIAAAIIFVLDLFPGLRRASGADEGKGGMARLAAMREADDESELELAADPASLRRQAAFALWVGGFALLVALTNIYVAMPVALVAIFLVIRVPLLHIAVIVGVTGLGFYGLLHYLLHVRL